ncbi:MAG: PEP-CTERM sorting domain-containing protein, partial [Dolichospermum sp.]|nr:PEP-CTERM sorting domain-containing protein [Dolichospermum sp.]
MKVKNLLVAAGLVVSSVLAVSNSAQAASFTTNYNQVAGPKSNTWLNSITQNNKTVSAFSFVNRAEIIQNDLETGTNNGAASTDKGDNVSIPLGTRKENPTGADIAEYLGNKQLNSIIDTEDFGKFNIDVFFDSVIKGDNSGLDSLFFWERGMNSDLQIQAIKEDGTYGTAFKLLRSEQAWA